jgi:hypothetical protein
VTDIVLTPEQERLALAINDMRQAAAAARLLTQQTDLHERRALETAYSVCCARPWIDSNRGGRLKNKWRPAAGPDRELHKRLLDLRRKTYAHLDPAGGRKAFAQQGAEEVLGIVEQWDTGGLDPTAVADLCDRQAARFVEALVEQIDAAGNPV